MFLALLFTSPDLFFASRALLFEERPVVV